MSIRIETLLTEHGDYLYRFALARLRDPHLAEDAVQETLLAVLQGSGFSGRSATRTWLTGILKHKIVDQFRRAQREAPLEGPDQPGEEGPGMDALFERGRWVEPPRSWGDPGSLLQQDQFLSVLQQCLDRLPPAQARIFLLREVEESDNEDICKELDITPTNAWVMLYRARMGLRQCLEIHWLGGAR